MIARVVVVPSLRRSRWLLRVDVSFLLLLVVAFLYSKQSAFAQDPLSSHGSEAEKNHGASSTNTCTTAASTTSMASKFGDFVDDPIKFLQEHVFGQQDAASSSSSSSCSSHGFLSMLQGKMENESSDGDKETSNPFLSLLEGLARFSIPSILDKKDDVTIDNNDIPETKEENKMITDLLIKARMLKEEEDDVDGLEFLNRITVNLKKAAKQLEGNFGDPLSSIDAYIAFSVVYFGAKEDARMNPVWKRKMHRFYDKVSKKDLIELHDALYLSTLAYVDTEDHFRQGLESFQNNSWELLSGTTKSLPNFPANFLLIHKELAPLEEPSLLPFLDGKKETEVTVTLVVRGTKDFPDALSDSLLDPVEYKGGHVHGGILESGKALANYYLPWLEELREATGRDRVRVVCIGHSLGAGAATVVAMELKEYNFLEVEAVGFGCPSLLSRDLAETTKEYITTVVNDADIIPRMSGASMANLLFDLMEYDWTDDALEDIEFSLNRARKVLGYGHLLPDTKIVLRWVKNHLEKVVKSKYNKKKRDRLPSLLIPPGTCIHIFRDGFGFSAAYTPCDFFQSVDFSQTLVDDHLIDSGYNRAMLSAVQDIDRDYKFQFPNDVLGIVGL